MEEHEVFRSDCAIYDALYCGTKAISPQGTRDLYVSNRFSNNDAGTTEDARHTVAIVEAAYRSAAEGRKVSLAEIG